MIYGARISAKYEIMEILNEKKTDRCNPHTFDHGDHRGDPCPDTGEEAGIGDSDRILRISGLLPTGGDKPDSDAGR